MKRTTRLAQFQLLVAIIAGLFASPVIAQPALVLGGDQFNGWIGLGSISDGVAVLADSQTATFRYPDGPRGQYKHGFRVLNDSAAEWQNFYGVECEISLPDARTVELTAIILRAQRGEVPETPVRAQVKLSGAGWHSVMLPWSAFQFDQANRAFLKYVKEFSLTARFPDGPPSSNLQIRRVRVVKAPAISLECEIRGRAARPGQTVEYEIEVGNCSPEPQTVVLNLPRVGWEEMNATVEPATLQLAPGETRAATLRVTVSDRVPPGGHEEQILQAIPNGNAALASQLRFVTASELRHPYVLHTPERWREVRAKVANYDWAKASQAEIVARANAWRVPEVASPPGNDPDDTMGPFLFHTQVENDLLACGSAWQLTRNPAYAQKITLFLRRLSNPTNGYPATLRGCNQSLVQEGHFFQHLAMAYDMIIDSGVLSDADRRQIENTFRIYIETIDRANDYGPINNWNVAEVCGAFYCSLAMQDLVSADHFFSGPSGICDQLAKGTMDDGWWYECSISYNMWVASEFTQVALAYEPFGVNFRDLKIPANYSPKAMLVSELSGGVATGTTAEERHKPFGMNPDIFGPNRRPYRKIRDMWNSLLPFLDYRGVMFGVNDSAETKVTGNRTEVGGQPFEIAYYAYRDPAYAAVIKMGDGKRDLLYAVPDLPEKTPEHYRDNAFADNVGLVLLRSQTTNRPVRAQIQAVLHYGTHGWAHGHYDRTDLLSLMRYGRSFWNPESVFWAYEPFMYKFYCQCSVNHNMVVVDEKMQEATPGERLLFHPGQMMQATAVQTTARWSYPPYGGMVYDYVPVKTFAEKCWREGRSVPLPANPPPYGYLTGYTEPILQRRLMLVLDDYVVLADFVKGSSNHTFENLLQLKGFTSLDAPGKKFLHHDGQWNPDPVGSAQFVTDCDWYQVNAPAKACFEESFGPNADNAGNRTIGNEDGPLKLDVHILWPPQPQIMIGTAPEMHDVSKRLYYTIRGDGKTITEGKFGAWILGSADIDVPLDGVNELELETKTELARQPTLFWASARIVTTDGKEIPLVELSPKLENVTQPPKPGADYFGGPIKIVGNEYKSAVPAEPENEKLAGIMRVNLAGLHAARFKAVLGGDYPLGNEAARRKVYVVRAPSGTQARFLTVIEPYEDQPVIKSAIATDADTFRVELNDGRVQEIHLKNLENGGHGIEAEVRETKAGQVLRTESVAGSE